MSGNTGIKPGDTVYYLGMGEFGDFPPIRKAVVRERGSDGIYTHVWVTDDAGHTHPAIVITENLRTDILDLINDLREHIKNECIRLEGWSCGIES